MKKKLGILIITLIVCGGLTWAAFNLSTLDQSQKNTNSEQSDKKSSIPGGQTITNNSKKDENSKDNKTKNTSADSDSSRTIGGTSSNTLSSDPSNNSSRQSNSSSSSANQNTSPSNSQPHSSPNSPSRPSNPSTPSNPSNPNIPPTPPVNPPDSNTPPTNPPVNPPTSEQTDQQKASRLLNSLKSSTNQNVAQFINDDNKIRTVIWTKGITAPNLGTGGDFRRFEENHGGNQFVTYTTLYRDEFLNSGWYDVDKSPGTSAVDRNLCFGAVASNQLHWWMNYNKNHIQQFLTKTNYGSNLPASQVNSLKDLRTYINSFRGQQDSRIFTMMKTYFGNNNEGYYADPLIDMFINGHRPKPNAGVNDPDWTHDFQMDPRGGFFHDVFGKRNITRRLNTSSFNEFNNEIKKAFRKGESVGLVHLTSGYYTHIITVWGLEYDLDGKLVGIYVTDSDDQDDIQVNGMKRYGVNNVNNKAVLSNNLTNPNAGARVDQISTLGLGEDKWSQYFE